MSMRTKARGAALFAVAGIAIVVWTHFAQQPARTALTFTGAVKATANSAVDVLPVYSPSAGSTAPASPNGTQCTSAGSGSDWKAQITVTTPGNQWVIVIAADGTDFASPAPGRYQGLDTPAAARGPQTLNLSVSSAEPLTPALAAVGASYYGYQTPADHNGGNGEVTVNSNLTSGSLDVWLTPDDPRGAGLVFELSGDWSCR
ncbi:MAG TPA: hypothetical protein VGM10_25600 [Actinocrinis sp.]